jgi:hypothetical protein
MSDEEAAGRPSPAAAGGDLRWAGGTFTYHPLISIATINRDPNIFTNTPILDRDYQSRSEYLYKTPKPPEVKWARSFAATTLAGAGARQAP